MQTVLLVDDHDEARLRMRRLIEETLDSRQIFESATIGDAIKKINANVFDMVVLDLALPDGDGESLIRPILDKNANCYVVISTIHDEGVRLIGALSAGAHGYLLKDQSEETLKQALAGILRGIPPLSASVTRRILEYLRQKHTEYDDIRVGRLMAATESKPGIGAVSDQTEDLTPRETEILVFLARGFNRPDIAGMLNISKHTVATHVSNVYGKLNISSRIEAAASARMLGLL